MNTDSHGAAQPQPKRISPQRRRERGGSVPGSAQRKILRGLERNASSRILSALRVFAVKVLYRINRKDAKDAKKTRRSSRLPHSKLNTPHCRGSSAASLGTSLTILVFAFDQYERNRVSSP